VGAQEQPRAAPPDPWRSLRSARVPPMHYLDKPRRPSIGPIGWVRIQSATRTKLGQISTGVDNATVRCAIYTRKSSEEGLDQEFNSLQARRGACETFISSQRHEGWVCLPAAYDGGGFSGATMDRSALQRLLADITAGRVDIATARRKSGARSSAAMSSSARSGC
jgi:Resolvase, N terminal domain